MVGVTPRAWLEGWFEWRPVSPASRPHRVRIRGLFELGRCYIYRKGSYSQWVPLSEVRGADEASQLELDAELARLRLEIGSVL